jgi:hypothetical protein
MGIEIDTVASFECTCFRRERGKQQHQQGESAGREEGKAFYRLSVAWGQNTAPKVEENHRSTQPEKKSTTRQHRRDGTFEPNERGSTARPTTGQRVPREENIPSAFPPEGSGGGIRTWNHRKAGGTEKEKNKTRIRPGEGQVVAGDQRVEARLENFSQDARRFRMPRDG